MIGQSLEQIRKDLRLMPTAVLMQYKQNPSKQAIEGMPMDMLAGLELSRRAELQQAQIAQTAPNAQQMPTVVDQRAMGLMGMAQQPAVNPAMPGQPTQFTPQQAAPQPAPQAAQAPAQPAQPTQQQPQKLAVGGIASLGDMQDANDQGTVYPSNFAPGQPVQMMAGGGIVAFKDNPDQPVDADMPATDNRSQFRKDVGELVDRLTPTEEEQQFQQFLNERRMQGAPIRYFTQPSGEYQKNKAVREFINDNPQAFSTPEARRQFRADPSGFISSYKAPAPEGATAAPTKDDGAGSGTVKPSDITVSQGGGANMDAILRQLTQGGGGGFDASKMQSLIDRYMKPTEQETAYQNLVREQMDAIRNRPSPEVSEDERKRIIKEQFDQNQAITRPYYEQMQKMIDEERAATKERYGDKAADAMIRAGLRGLSSRKPGMQGFFEGATEGMDFYDKASELEAAANSKARQAQMDLTKARMADEKGDRESAQRYFDSYQKNRRDAEVYEIQRSNMLINAQKGLVDTEGKRERAGMGLQMALDKAQMGAELGAMRNQMGLMRLMQGAQPKALTVNEKLALEKRVGEVFGNPASPEFQKYVGAAANGKQLLADLKNGRIKPDNPQFQAIVEQAKRRYMNDMVSGTRSSSGVTSYDQAASDLLGQ